MWQAVFEERVWTGGRGRNRRVATTFSGEHNSALQITTLATVMYKSFGDFLKEDSPDYERLFFEPTLEV
jgi:hypothetical protein